MSYLVFARKWRPQNFEEIIGQDHIVATLKNAISSKRLAHAYLFSGPRGVGKTSTARILAKALNCQKDISVNPCNECSTCKEISQGRNLDVLEIDGASNRGIDEIRQLRENVKFSPSAGRYKIYIIDEVHMLTPEAFNALLKTLEEPPEHVKFIFATTQPHKVIPTIISRCQRFDFRRIPILKIVERLKEIVKSEHIDIEEKVLISIAKASDGSLRDAESILDQLISYSADKISLKEINSLLGLIEQDVLFEFSKLVIDSDSFSLIRLLDTLVSSGKDLSQVLDNLIEHFRNLMIAHISDAKALTSLVDLPQEFIEAIAKQSRQLTREKILEILQTLIEVKDLGKRINSLRIPLEVAIIKLAYNANQTKINSPLKEELKDKKNPSGESIIKTIPAVIKNERGSFSISDKKEEINPLKSVDDKPILDINIINSVWKDCLTEISKKKMSVATYLADCLLEKCEKNVVTFSLPKSADFHREFLDRKDNRELVENTLEKLLQVKIRLAFVISNREPKNEAQDAFVKSILETFKGRVI
ncbi:MAG: DNA polymerase III subunit gamma/tau [Candidatus Omnitrophota bacterium]